MKIPILLGLLAVLAAASFANADITTWYCADDGDGGIDMTVDPLQGTAPDYTVTMAGPQHMASANVYGWFNVEGDPTVWIIESVENATTFSWNKYEIWYGMPQSFTVPALTAPDGWTAVKSAVVPGTIPGHTPPGGDPGNVVHITYTADTPADEIAPGSSGDFGFKVSFLGSVSFCTEQVATPEPASLALLALGGLFIRRRK